MTIRNRAGKVAASLVLVGAGLVAGFAIASAPAASGAMGQETAPAVMGDSSGTMPAMVPQGVFVDVAEQLGPKVVFIEAERPTERPSNQRFQRFFDEFFGRDGEAPEDGEAPPDGQFEDFATSQGSGVIISEDGLVLTNAHVVASVNNRTQEEDRATSVRVTLQNDTTYTAEIIGVDLGTDIALLKIDATGLPWARLGDSDEIRVGEWVMAVGAPFGLQNTVSAGIVSAVGRGQLLGMATPYQDFIQTDAAINPGNSGGPLVNLHGEVVGINTAIATTGMQQAFAGVGFAVPANLARDIMEELRDTGRVVRGYLGVQVRPLDRTTREGLALDPSVRGAIIASVNDGGPAQVAGLEAGDIVVGMNGRPLESQQDFLQRVAWTRPGEEITLDVLRADEGIEIEVTLAERPDEASILASQAQGGLAPQPDDRQPEEPEALRVRSLGLRVAELTPRLRSQLQIDESIEGLVIIDVSANGPAARAGLYQGAVIMRVRRDDVRTSDHFAEAIEGLAPGETVALFVYLPRQDLSTYVNLRVAE